MKKIFIFVILVLLAKVGKAQQTTIGRLTEADIALFQKIEAEMNPDRIIKLAFTLIFISDDKAPLPLLEEAKMLFTLSQKKKNAVLESIAMGMHGQAYRITGDFTKSQEYHYKAINIAKKTSNYSLLAYTLNQSAHMYKDREENEKAIAIYKEASEVSLQGNEPVFMFYPIMNLGFVYMQAKKADSAMFYSTKAVNMIQDLLLDMRDVNQKEIVERSLLVYCLSNLAGSYSMLNDKNNANKYYKQAFDILEKYKGYKSRYFQFAYFSLANHHMRYDMQDSAIVAAKLAIESVSDGPLEYLSAKPAKMISDYYEGKNADSIVRYLKIYLKGNEVMNSTRVTQQLQMKSVEERQKTLEFQRAKEAYRNKIAFYLLGVGLAVLLFVAAFMYHSSQQRKRVNAELQKQKDQVEETLTELKSTQAQLIQQEKLASLGQLTAGIAHEIKNPLNFVNNFSEVNSELISELVDEVDKGNIAEVKFIAADIKENSEKINHHGKRADAIVKSMLAHSRTSSGKKELTNLNTLAEEYLKLSYHGIKAKNNQFNANYSFEPDNDLLPISILPQEIGRVLLNLLNNAFYAVYERSKLNEPGYFPQVTLTTGTAEKGISIVVHDNGKGIPEGIREKIFQPFFTTKPTGEGTGLGLSLSYDIITKGHQGKIDFESKEKVGTTFTITIPIV